jgi:sterol O-acyltransferase
MIMKFHAFVRSNVERVLEAERERDESTVPKPVQCPEISKYLYFLFAPTLIYRDNYPKSPRRRWDKVFLHLAEVFGCIVYCNALFEQLCIPVYGSFKIPELTLASFIRLNCMSIIPGGWILVTGFFVLLHTWQNLFAELLRFGDRQFYTVSKFPVDAEPDFRVFSISVKCRCLTMVDKINSSLIIDIYPEESGKNDRAPYR